MSSKNKTIYILYCMSSGLTLKTTLADISATTNARKQSAVTFKVSVLWLRNQHYYNCDVTGIKMTYRDLPYYEGIRPKHAVNINFTKTSTKIMQTVYIRTFRKWSISWSQVIVSSSFKHRLIRHQWRIQPYTAHVTAIN